MTDPSAAYQKYAGLVSLGSTLNPTQIEYIHSEAPIRANFKGNQGGGCLKVGTNIQMLDGCIRRIEDIKQGDKILAIGEDYKIYPSVVRNRIDSGIKSLIEIITKHGRTITSTPCHPFLTIDGWKSIGELNCGDYIAVPRKLLIAPKTDAYVPPPSWIPIILGYLIGDGCIINNVSFSNRDEKIINEIRAILPDGLSIKDSNPGDTSRTDYRISGSGGHGSNEIINLLKHIGLWGCNSYAKFVPDIIAEADDRTVSLFLSRLFSCDGWVDDRGVGYASVSKELIHGIQSLLLRFGILSRIREKKNHHWGTNSIRTDERIDYLLTIQRFADIEKFSQEIGIFSKQVKLDALIEKKSQNTPKENCDVIPIDISYLLDKLPRRKGNNNIQGTDWVYENNDLYHLYREARGRTISRAKANLLGSSFNDNRLLSLSDSDILWDKITKITPTGEAQCYDLEIDWQHNFIANNIFAHNTAVMAIDCVLRLLRIHPVQKRNVLNKPIRLVSKVKPKQEGDEENQQYVELLKLIPQYLIRKDVTARSSTMTIRDPLGGSDNKLEFMSSSQELDAFMSVQRSALYQDEEIERIKWDESLVRLLREGGDATLNLTPAKGLDWVFDSIWRRASKIYRSAIICKKFGSPPIEDTGYKSGIECFCWATDDNPALDKATIDRIFGDIDDPDELAMRRYGVFRQVSGRIYKAFDPAVHVKPFDKVFDAALFRTYWHYRIIDYHPSKPWDVSFVVVTPRNEWIVWNELHQTHDNRTTLELRDEIKRESVLDEDEEFNRCTLIDPLSEVKQANTGFSVFDDLKMGANGLRRLTPADTKNSPNGGRMNVKMRLKNALICGVPGNNLNKNDLTETRYGVYLPTLWFLDNCRRHIEHFKSWRYVDWKQEHVKAVKTVKRESEKFSDYCRNLEFMGSLNPAFYERKHEYWEPSKLFQGRQAAGWR